MLISTSGRVQPSTPLISYDAYKQPIFPPLLPKSLKHVGDDGKMFSASLVYLVTVQGISQMCQHTFPVLSVVATPCFIRMINCAFSIVRIP